MFDWIPLTDPKIGKHLFRAHSLSRGGAQAFVPAKWPVRVIQRWGRWGTDVAFVYIQETVFDKLRVLGFVIIGAAPPEGGESDSMEPQGKQTVNIASTVALWQRDPDCGWPGVW